MTSAAVAPSSHEPSFRQSTAQLGLVVLLCSLGALFLAAIVAHVITRVSLPPNPIALPRIWALGFGSLLAISISVGQWRAIRSIRSNDQSGAQRMLRASFALAIAFLCVQAWGWYVLSTRLDLALSGALAALTFYLLTGLHAAHVVGGLVPLAIVTSRAQRQRYTSSHFEGASLCAQYWHFLTAVWLVLAVVLATL